MIEEPYRWVEAITNRREYVEHQLAAGSPIACVTYKEGILFFTLGRERQKIFEIYDRIAMGAIGHPGDIERLRMAAIEVASTEGFTRSAADVSLRRLANYSLSPALKAAFEQIYGAPYLARMIFAELGMDGEPNLFVRIDYDGAIHGNGGALAHAFEDFGVLSGTARSTGLMEKFLASQNLRDTDLAGALDAAFNAWAVGHLSLAEDAPDELPSSEQIAEHLSRQLSGAVIEAAVLERKARMPICYRQLSADELASVGKA
jgi:proteasome alpha subunit